MERKRCQVCDGPVVNGRCRLCGMPYRNDETLYHLNENRSDHYRHATSRARAIMRQEEIPLGDKKPGNAVGKSYKSGTAGTVGTGNKYGQKTGGINTGSGYKPLTGSSSNKGSGSTYKGTSAAKQGNKSAASSYTASNRQAAASSYTSQNRQTTTSAYNTANKKGGVYTQKPVKKKKGSLLGWLIMIVVIFSVVPELWDTLRDDLAPVLEESLDGIFGSDASAVSYEMRSGDVLEVGKDLEDGIVPGYYIASCDNGFVSFMIMGEDGETGTMTVAEGLENKITLKEGDLIGIINAESEDSALLLTAR